MLNTDAVQDWMEARGIDSVAELARRTDISRAHLANILAGRRRAQPSQVLALTTALGLRPRTLLGPENPADAIRQMAAAADESEDTDLDGAA